MNDIVAIVVTFNRREMLKATISHLLKQTYSKFDIMIIDNSSTDGTDEMIKEYSRDSRILYYNTGKNLGGAGGFQYGMKKAIAAKYNYIWIMDDDCFADDTALERLVHASKEVYDSFGFLSSVAYWKDGTRCNMNIQRISLTKKMEDYESEIVPVIMATFVSLFIKADVVKELGLPIKEFFIWSDDLEYTRRISNKYPCYVVNRSRVLHNMNSNDKVNIATDSEERLNRYTYLYRNEWYVYRREGVFGIAYYFLRVFYHLLKVLFGKYTSKSKKMKIIINSVKSGLHFNPEIEYM